MFFGAKIHENWEHTILVKTLKIVIFFRENKHFQEIEDWQKKINQKSMKNRMFFGTSISEAFCKDFGKILEAKILDFRIFFDVFSMQNLECKLEGQQIEKKS